MKDANQSLPKSRARSTETDRDQALTDLAKDLGKTDVEEHEAYVEDAR